MKRIRYIKTDKPHVFRSVRNFLGQQDALYKVFLDTEKMTYWILNVRQQLIIRSTEKDGLTPPTNIRTSSGRSVGSTRVVVVSEAFFFIDLHGVRVGFRKIMDHVSSLLAWDWITASQVSLLSICGTM